MSPGQRILINGTSLAVCLVGCASCLVSGCANDKRDGRNESAAGNARKVCREWYESSRDLCAELHARGTSERAECIKAAKRALDDCVKMSVTK